jgi:uncharacterized membrane protein YraQ (UPF0718 family)
MNSEKNIKKAAISAVKPIYRALPILVGAVLLVSLASTLIPKQAFTELFKMNLIVDPIIGSALGSILAGNPITSYILGGEFLNLGISLVAVTAFLVAWVTVGIVQLPAEIMMLGKKFSITRNILSFIFSIIVAIITVIIVGVIPW